MASGGEWRRRLECAKPARREWGCDSFGWPSRRPGLTIVIASLLLGASQASGLLKSDGDEESGQLRPGQADQVGAGRTETSSREASSALNVTQRPGMAELDPDASDTVPVYMQHMTVVLVTLHLSVFVTGLVGNSLVCLSVYRNKSLQTITNYYIVNLAVADFLVILICLPPTVYWDLTLTWSFGLVLCKLVLYLQSISVSVSVLTLTCISIDRWYAICKPLKFSSTKSRAKLTIALIWLVSMLIASPDVIFLTTRPLYEENDYVYMDCTYSWPEQSTKMYQLCIVTLLFVLPFVLMTISYSQIVNVLWRNETMAESMQNSMLGKQQEALQRAARQAAGADLDEQPVDGPALAVGGDRPAAAARGKLALKRLGGWCGRSWRPRRCCCCDLLQRPGQRAEAWPTSPAPASDQLSNGRLGALKEAGEPTTAATNIDTHSSFARGARLEAPNCGANNDDFGAQQTSAMRQPAAAAAEEAARVIRWRFSEPLPIGFDPEAKAVGVQMAQQQRLQPAPIAEPEFQQHSLGSEAKRGARERAGDRRVVGEQRNNKGPATNQIGQQPARDVDGPPAGSTGAGVASGTGQQARQRLAGPNLIAPSSRSAARRHFCRASDAIGADCLAGATGQLEGASEWACASCQQQQQWRRQLRRASGQPRGQRRECQARVTNKAGEYSRETRPPDGPPPTPTPPTPPTSPKSPKSPKLPTTKSGGPPLMTGERAKRGGGDSGGGGETGEGCRSPRPHKRHRSRHQHARHSKRRQRCQRHAEQPARCNRLRRPIDIDRVGRPQPAGGAAEMCVALNGDNYPPNARAEMHSSSARPPPEASDVRPADLPSSSSPSSSSLLLLSPPPPSPQLPQPPAPTPSVSETAGAGALTGDLGRAAPTKRRPDKCLAPGRPVGFKVLRAPAGSGASAADVPRVVGAPNGPRGRAAVANEAAANNLDRLIGGGGGDGSGAHETSESVPGNKRVNNGAQRADGCALGRGGVVRDDIESPTRPQIKRNSLQQAEQADFLRPVSRSLASSRSSLEPRARPLARSSGAGSSVASAAEVRDHCQLWPGAGGRAASLSTANGNAVGGSREQHLSVGLVSSSSPAGSSNNSLQSHEVARELLAAAAAAAAATGEPPRPSAVTCKRPRAATCRRISLEPISFQCSAPVSRNSEGLVGVARKSRASSHLSGSSLGVKRQQIVSTSSAGSASAAMHMRFCKLIESRKKAAKMLIVIVIMFGLCYLPVHFLNTLRITIGLPQNDITTIASLVSHWLCYFNSAVNPLIYNLMSGKFRHEFANLFFCRWLRRATGPNAPNALN